jgi:hypothetical protein
LGRGQWLTTPPPVREKDHHERNPSSRHGHHDIHSCNRHRHGSDATGSTLGEMKSAVEQQASDKVQSPVDQTIQKASDKSDAAMGKIDSKLDNLLGK